MSDERTANGTTGPARLREILPPAAAGAVAGLLAAFTSLTVAELTAAGVREEARPVNAVGGAVIDRTPAPVKDWAIAAFGTHDKLALQLGILALLGLFAIVVGVSAMRFRRAGALAVLGFGLFGALVAAGRPEGAGADAVPSLTGAVAGAAVLYVLAGRGLRMVPGRPGPGERAGRRGRAKPPDSGAARTLGNAHWIGVRLADLLAEAGVRPPSRGGPADQLIARSVEGLALDPVATAASNNEALTTLVGAVDAAGLVDTLNDARDITVFAPVDDAFAAIPEEDLNAVLADEELLTGVLTYHVMGERIAPEQLADGTFETLQGGTVTTAGSGESFTVNDEAAVVCGNVQTANATVYLIDTVLMP